MFGIAVQTRSLILLQTEEGQRVDGGGRGGRRFGRRGGRHVKTTGEGIARVQRHGGVDAADQRVQVEVPQRRHQRVGDGVGCAGDAGMAV